MKSSVSWRSPVAASSTSSSTSSHTDTNNRNITAAATTSGRRQRQPHQPQQQRTATMNGYHHHYDYYHTPQATAASAYHQYQQQQQQQTPHNSQYYYSEQQQATTTTPPPPVLVLDASNPTPVALIEQASHSCRMSAVTLPRFSSLLLGGGRGQSQQQQQKQSHQQQSSSRRRGRQEMTNHHHHDAKINSNKNNTNSVTQIIPNQNQQQMHQQQYEPHELQYQRYLQQLQQARTPTTTSTSTSSNTTITAAQFARLAPCAGFLFKQGINIPELKRRFFVLQPTTYLYYFLSPTDTTPRGCLDLTDSYIIDLQQDQNQNQQDQQEDQKEQGAGNNHGSSLVVDGYLPDLSTMDKNQQSQEAPIAAAAANNEDRPYRFAICWDENQEEENHHDHDTNRHHHNSRAVVKRIILQARNAELAQQWIQAIQCERLDYVKQRWHESVAQVTNLQQTIVDLQQELQQLRLVEADRDGAVLDAQKCRHDFNVLNEAVRKLSLQLVRPLPPAPVTSPRRNNHSQHQQSGSDKAKGEDGETGIRETTTTTTTNNNSNDNNDLEKATVGEDEKKEEPEIVILQQQQNSENNKNDTTTTRDQQQESLLQAQQPGRRRLLNSSLLDEAVLVSSDTDQAAEQQGWLENNDELEFAPHDDAAILEQPHGWDDDNNNDNDDNDDSMVRHDYFLNVPGVHFSSLYNACQQLRDNWQLASQEAATAIHDVTVHENKVEKLQARMKRAEKHLCQIWEENCSIRKSLKQKKREKRVLVREVRSLQEQQQQTATASTMIMPHQQQEQTASGTVATKRNIAQQQHQQQQGARSPRRTCNNEQTVQVASRALSGNGPEEDGSSDEDEERLINELEEHVLSSIRLHEQILGANGSSTRKLKADASSAASYSGAVTMGTAATSCETSQASRPMSHFGEDENQAMNRPSDMGSKALFDDSDDDDDDGDDDALVNGAQGEEETQDNDDRVDVSSTCAEASVTEETIPAVNDRNCDSPDSTPERPNPLLRLDDDSISIDHHPNLCAASSQSESSRSAIVTRQATHQLSCPLADVVDRNGTRSDLAGISGDLQVYHLTFYSRKIGLQFQKVPPPPTKSKGLLTDALTADLLPDVTAGSGNTAAELRRIASISTWAKKSDFDHGGGGRNVHEPVLEVATPIDAVLVCGFHGFDDSGANIRPKLGARLVAFDGVSVEVGMWTFESIRKSIQARSRPLTLSFRNDFLTTEQRTILTKAVKDVGAAVPPPRPSIQYRVVQNTSRPPSVTPSMQTSTSHESDVFINDIPTTPVVEEDFYDYNHELNTDAWSVSISGSSCDHRSHGGGGRPQSFSAARSVSSAYSSNRQQPQQHNSFRSFSEAGSSTTSVLSAVGPLMAQLLPSVVVRKKEQHPYTPEYLRREGSSLEDTPQHQDFKSSLL